MKRISNNSKCKLAIFVILAIVLIMQLTACSNDADTEEIETPESYFASEFTDLMQLLENLNFAGSAVVIGDTLYFSAIEQSDTDEQFSTYKMF